MKIRVTFNNYLLGRGVFWEERGKEWEYRVIAVNKSGEGQPSNTVMAVL